MKPEAYALLVQALNLIAEEFGPADAIEVLLTEASELAYSQEWTAEHFGLEAARVFLEIPPDADDDVKTQ